MTDSLLIGRDHPASVLRSAVGRTTDSHGGLVLVTGEAGIGKTTLVSDVVFRSRGEALALSATSWESDAVPGYWLWTQILRSLRSQLSDEAWSTLAGSDSRAIAGLLGTAVEAKPGEFEVFDAVTQLLIGASHHRPLIVVLDDLHFADDESVDLLKFASQHTWFERILFIGTYRDVEVDAGHRLRARMLPLVAKAALVTLDGLDERGVADLIRTTVGSVPGADTIAEITRRTGGNPFFVEQTAQLWATGQSVDATTAGMRDALHRRFEQLDPRLLRMLTLASVGGREFHSAVMAEAAGIDVYLIEDALSAACQARLIRRESDRYVFVHDLVRESLYHSMSEAEAAGHHACIVRALVAEESLQKLMLPSEMAHHAWLAGDALAAETAVEFLWRAAKASNSCIATKDTETYYRRALERCTPDMVRRRVLLRLDLASTLQWLRRNEEAWDLQDRSVVEAEDSGDLLLFARAVLSSPVDDRREVQRPRKRRLYEALLGEAPDPGLDDDELTRRILLRFLIDAKARESDDDISFGLWALHAVIWGPGTAAERQRIVEELAEVARRTGDDDTRLFTASLRWVALLEQGDPAYLDQLEVFCGLAEHIGGERWKTATYVDRSVIDLLRGDFETAERRIRDAQAIGGLDPAYRDMIQHQLKWELALARGDRLEQQPSAWRSAFGSWHAELLHAVTALENGEIHLARRLHRRIAADKPSASWESLWVRFEAGLAAAEGDAAMIERVRGELAPYAGEWLVAMWGMNINGPVSYWLGILDAADGNPDAAVRHFDDAAEQAELVQASHWAERVRKARAGLAAEAEPAGDRMHSGLLFRRDGSTWTLEWVGETVHLPHTKGLADLRQLLAQPGEEIGAAALLDPGAGADVEADARLGGDDVLDNEARARFRDHLEALDEQIDTAAALGDDARAAALDEERQALIEQLKVATGLGGRSRRLGDNAERARKSVTNRIRNTLKKIESVHPTLAGHLRESISTGSSCVYRPAGDVPRWRF